MSPLQEPVDVPIAFYAACRAASLSPSRCAYRCRHGVFTFATQEALAFEQRAIVFRTLGKLSNAAVVIHDEADPVALRAGIIRRAA